ncbi:MAG TPA: 23S rRNA (uracil(1939)-C(5))-methyltransferase RlmD [Candidatus Rubrimentiphilum sp.]|nr:23S rRNA (uracil(1939)-C(5))-methyltransferase RlmD [Candidatus Rubrimentiphilum sp.]
MTSSAKLGAQLELTFNDLLTNGQAVGRSDGLAIFCFGPLPGERARVAITDVKPKYAVAECLELIERSPDRVEPFCPVFGTCGGCQTQHLSYDAQLRWKRDVVRNALERIGGFSNVEVAPTIGMRNPRAYRNKMSLVVERARKRVGFYKQRSHDVVEIDHCPIVMPALDAQIVPLNTAKNDPATAAAFASVRHIVSRSDRNGKTVMAFTTERPSAPLEQLAPTLCERLDNVTGLVNSYELSGANAVLGRRAAQLAGSAQIEETIDGIKYRVSTQSFFQVNVEIVEKIFAHLKPRLNRPLKVHDLYSGAGTFSLFFASCGSTVIGVEENARAVAEAQENAQRNGLEARVAFRRGPVEQIVAKLPAADVAFLDPPRKGSDEKTLGALVRLAVPAIWYLSCDPATLARDLKFLGAKRYHIDEVVPFDMFPQTGHVESLVTLSLPTA